MQRLLGIEIPVIQAPMTYIARAELAAAVSNAGGMGVIETLTPEGQADLLRVRDLTDKPVGANLMIQGWKHDASIVEVLVKSGITYVATSAGDPALFTQPLKDAGVTVSTWSETCEEQQRRPPRASTDWSSRAWKVAASRAP